MGLGRGQHKGHEGEEQEAEEKMIKSCVESTYPEPYINLGCPVVPLFLFFGGLGSLINPLSKKGTLFKPRLLGGLETLTLGLAWMEERKWIASVSLKAK